MDTCSNTNLNFNSCYCMHRLPCGYCTLLRQSCPMYPVVTPRWEVTCQGSTATGVQGVVQSGTSCGSDSVTMKDYPRTYTVTAENK